MFEVFEVDIFPKHINQSSLKLVDDFVAVGFAPLNAEKYGDYVEVSEQPDQRLTGDLLFLAKKMKVAAPPLHIATKDEKKIFNDYMRNNPQGLSLIHI